MLMLLGKPPLKWILALPGMNALVMWLLKQPVVTRLLAVLISIIGGIVKIFRGLTRRRS